MRSAERPAGPHDLDELTLRRAQRGDHAAQTALVERYERPVFALLSRMVGRERALVEDLAQETFLRVLRALPDFDTRGPARLVTWILTIATRLALDDLRRRGARAAEAVAYAVPLAPPPMPEEQAQRHALGQALVRAVEELGAPFRAAFLLREVHGLSYEEIALALEIHPGTVKSRLSRARATLQEALAEVRDG